MIQDVYQAVQLLALQNTSGSVLSSEIADYLVIEKKEVLGYLKELQDDGLVERNNNYFKPLFKQDDTPAEDAFDKLVKNGTDATVVSEPLKICEPSDFEPEHSAIQAINLLSADLKELEEYRKTPKATIKYKQLKLEVLSRLSWLLSDDIAEVLNSIAEDLGSL